MANRSGPVYESTFVVDVEQAAELESWLRRFVQTSLQLEGIEAVHQHDVDTDEIGRVGTLLQFDCRDDAALDELLDSYFASTDVALAEAFGDSASVVSRCLREDHRHDTVAIDNPDCLNCGAHLSGQYCGNCGQRSVTRLISIWQLLAEAFGDLLELDSRLWRTVIPLMIRPGQLTRDYLLGRRARYMPPFRMYLVLSLIFFVVAFFDPREDLGLLFEPAPPPTAAEEAAREAGVQQAKEELLEGFQAGIAGEDADSADQPADSDDSDSQLDAGPDDADSAFRIGVNDDGETRCDINSESIADWPDWFKRRLTPERLEVVCDRILADDGATFLDLLLDKIPVALIVLLPLMALVLKILYPLSRRYFVEHLLFIVHFHAFFFLILTLQIVFSRLTNALGVAGILTNLVIVAASLYIPVYLYMALRRVYDQGHILTTIKYLALVVAYWLGLSMTFFSATLFALMAVSTGTGAIQ
jgi:ribosomal protein S27AE